MVFLAVAIAGLRRESTLGRKPVNFDYLIVGIIAFIVLIAFSMR
jgi:hypothetical protein